MTKLGGKLISCQTLGLISRITHPLRWNQHAIHAYDDLWLIIVELLLGGADGFLEVLVGELWIEDRVALVFEKGRFDAAWH